MDKWNAKKQDAMQSQAQSYHHSKSKQFDLYGLERGKKITVKSMQRSYPKSELNQKYIMVESATENRNKQCSLANRLFFQAPNVNTVRTQGQHQTLLQTMDKKHTIQDVLEKKNLMITADITDPLRRDLLILPIQANFGFLKEGSVYEMHITIKNEDIMAARVTIKSAGTKYVKVFTKDKGALPMGISRKIFVRLDAHNDI